MKIKGVIVIVSLLVFACSQQKEFNLTGTIDDVKEGYVFLMDREDGNWVTIDSSAIAEGQFTFKGNVETATIYYLKTEAMGRSFLPIFMENSSIVCNIVLSPELDYTVEGSSIHLEYEMLKDKLDIFNDEIDAIYQKYKIAKKALDTIRAKELMGQVEAKDEEMNQFILDFAMQNPGSFVALYMVSRYSYNYDETDLEPIVNNFDKDVSNSKYALQIKDRVEVLKKVAIGQPAIDFEQETSDGEMLKLSTLYGTYLLVDFWASWCGPCRAENPNVVKSYQTYHEKGFNVLGVSFDDKRENWLKAIEDDGLTWNHVSDLKGWGNAAGELYGIRSIPSNVLLNPEGIIIAKNIRENELQEKLAEIFLE